MAQKTIVTLVDDPTGEEAENISTVEFALDGITYQLYLTEENSTKLHDALSQYVNAARKIGGRHRSGAPRPSHQSHRSRVWLQPRDAEVNPGVGEEKRP
jgi:hypothetical protein